MTDDAPTMRPGGRVLADALLSQGIDHVFAVPGESYLDVLDGLYAVRERVRLVTCRFEAGAVNMAEAYAKLTGRPAAAMVTRGPGACHGAIGVHVAMQDSTPLLLFVGQIPFGETDRDSFQEVDYRRMFGPLAKWVTQIDDARRIPELVARAVDVATAGRPGPVVIALSEEMQKRQVAVRDINRIATAPAYPDPAAMRRMAGLLAESRRPLVVLGGSGWSAAGRGAIRDFIVRQGLPAAVGFRRQALFDGRLENFVGDLGVGSDPALVARAKQADLVLAIGSRLGEATSQGYALFEPSGGVPIIQVHPDQSEIGRVFRPVLGITADLNAFAQAAAALPLAAGQAWRGWAADLRSLRQAGRTAPAYKGRLNLARAMLDLEDLAAPDAVFHLRRGQLRDLASPLHQFRRGAALHRPDQRGDGLRRAGRRGGGGRLSGPAGDRLRRRRRHVDDRPGDRHRLPGRRKPYPPRVQQRHVRDDSDVSGTGLSGPRLGHAADQPGFRQVDRGVRRPRRGG